MRTASAIAAAPISLTLRIVSGPHAGESFSFEKAVITLGRGAENEVVLPNDPKLSRKHIRITCDHEVAYVDNLSNRNPMLFKDKVEIKVELRPKDRIHIGETEIEFDWQSESGEKTVVAGTDALNEISIGQTEMAGQQQGSNKPPTLPPLNTTFDGSALNPMQASGLANVTAIVRGEIKPPKMQDLNSADLVAKSPAPQVRYTPTAPGSAVGGESYGPIASPTAGVRPAQRRTKSKQSNFGPLLVGLAAVVVILIIIFAGDDKKGKKVIPLKSKDQNQQSLQASAEAVEQHIKDKRLTEIGTMDRQYESAQSYYLKGFRDYRQGQYSRAIISFQAALSFEPSHVLAQRYLNQSIAMQAKIIDFNINQARRYREKNHFRLCKSSAQQVMNHTRLPTDESYKVAKQLYDECDTLSKGRF